MKKVAYVLMSALVALGSTACNGGNEKKPEQKDPTNTDNGYVAPEQNNAEKVDFMKECKPAKKNPCKDGLSCEELPGGENYCVKECDEDTQCPEGFLCGDDFGVYTGLCVYETPYFGPSISGEFFACPRDSMSNAGLELDKASKYFSDAGEKDYIYGLGFCAPICGAAGKLVSAFPADGGAYYQCGKISLDKDFDFFGLNGKVAECMENTQWVNINAFFNQWDDIDQKVDTVSTCGVVRDDNYFCDENAIRCGHAPGRTPILYDLDGLSTNESFDGVNYCDFSQLVFSAGAADKNGLHTGFADYPVNGLIGVCQTYCETNKGCECQDPNDTNCKVADDEFRACYILTSDAASDGMYGGVCEVFEECETAADCSEEEGYVAKCVSPSDHSIKDKESGKVYTLKTVTKKFCEYEQATK